MVAITLPNEYGYVVATGAVSSLVMFYLGALVGTARKTYNVPYPTMYVDQATCKENKEKETFNCIQRGHQNALETYPQFLFLLAFAGVRYPVIAAVSGVVWLAGRIVYAHGYGTGQPGKRNSGAFAYLGLLSLLGCSLATSAQMLGWI